MIDPADKQTQALPLDEQPAKRKRGRPSTGQAMTPAQKQKAYRERLKSRNVTENAVPAELLEQVRAAAAERIEQLERQLTEAKLALETTAKSNVTEKTLYNIESKAPGKRTWKLIGEGSEPFMSREQAERFISETIADGSKNKYRIVPA